MDYFDVIIVGGGLAGLTASIHLRDHGLHVLVIEEQEYPHHKVCGEYLSKEVLHYLDTLGVPWKKCNAVDIDTLYLSTWKGKSITQRLPLGGIGISRFALDHMMYQKASAQGVIFLFERVENIDFNENLFLVRTKSGKSLTSKFTIAAYGKRAGLDKALQRSFTKEKAPWLAVKSHYKWDGLPKNVVALHTFRGGYAGLSTTENNHVNLCYLVSYASFKKEKKIDNFTLNIISQNANLKQFINEAKPQFAEPLSIAQISFQKKKAVENHTLMCGDAAGLIHPLCGNGMAMAIHSAKIASEILVRSFLAGNFCRESIERTYSGLWSQAFTQRLWTGRQLQRLMLNENLSDKVMNLMVHSPYLLQRIIKLTHGKTI